jgi:hypothetical protein
MSTTYAVAMSIAKPIHSPGRLKDTLHVHGNSRHLRRDASNANLKQLDLANV